MTKGCDIGDRGSSVLLSQDDPPAFTVLNEGVGAAFLIVCDHAGRRIPERLDSLGLPPQAFERHIAWDIGVASVANALARRMGVPAILQTYSRLVVDCNRAPGGADAIATISDGQPIPGNTGLSEAEVAVRYREIFEPYHAAVGRQLRQATRVLIALHSFTPELGGVRRPWEFGVLHDGRSRFSAAILELLRAEGDLVVGDNEPYAMDGVDYTVPRHAMANGLDYLELEIRQDLIEHPSGQAAAAERLARLLPLALEAY
jgi:predicted N-formylglutamate amidohydrolase